MACTASLARQRRLAELATPVLITCARSKVSGIVHRVVETLVFLAPLDQKQTSSPLGHGGRSIRRELRL